MGCSDVRTDNRLRTLGKQKEKPRLMSRLGSTNKYTIFEALRQPLRAVAQIGGFPHFLHFLGLSDTPEYQKIHD